MFTFFLKHLVENIASNVCFIDMLSIDINNVQDVECVASQESPKQIWFR